MKLECSDFELDLIFDLSIKSKHSLASLYFRVCICLCELNGIHRVAKTKEKKMEFQEMHKMFLSFLSFLELFLSVLC